MRCDTRRLKKLYDFAMSEHYDLDESVSDVMQKLENDFMALCLVLEVAADLSCDEDAVTDTAKDVDWKDIVLR